MLARPKHPAISSVVSASGFASSSALSTQVTKSSASLPWQGILLEQSVSRLAQEAPTSATRHAICEMLATPAAGERPTSYGCNKSVRLFEARSLASHVAVPSTANSSLHAAVSWIHCELEHSFVHRIAEEIDYRHNADVIFTSGSRDVAVETMIGLLAEELDQDGTSGRLYADSLAHTLVVRVLLLASAATNATTARYRVSSLPLKALERVKARIEAEIGDPLSLEALAKESGYSRTHFLRMFRAATGLTPHQYLLDRRVSRAKELLQQTKAALADVAVACGFSSQSHMTDIFRTRVGVTPFDYRRGS